MSREAALGLVGVIAEGRYESRSGSRGFLDDRRGAFPELAVRLPLRPGLGLGFSLVPEQARIADWVYDDAPGGIDGATTYGRRTHRSEVLGGRAALALGWEVTDTLSVGISGGLVYNRNRLQAPYTFQSHPDLAGFKTLLDLETDGFGINGDFGLVWKASDSLLLGLNYRTPTRINTTGSASGYLRAQFDSLGLAGTPADFHYLAEVENKLPQTVAGGVSWQATEKNRVALELEWIGWASAFDDLTVDLSKGSNAAINGLLGSDGIVDTVPLDWEDRVVSRLGFEHQLDPVWALRLGYAYAKAPITSRTTLPMTAAISEHTITAGVGYSKGPWRVDAAYQRDLPASASLSDSRILSSEYLGSEIDINAHWFALTLGYEF